MGGGVGMTSLLTVSGELRDTECSGGRTTTAGRAERRDDVHEEWVDPAMTCS